MRTTLEDLYYGNITPCEQQMIPGSELKRAMDRVAKCEAQLMELLNEEGQQTLTRFIRSQHEHARCCSSCLSCSGSERRIKCGR